MRYFIAVGVFFAAAPVSARTLVVHPPQSIQAAVDRASAGDRIVVHPGTYRETGEASAVTITKDGIELVGLSNPRQRLILENAGGAQKYGVWVSPTDSLPDGDDEDPPCGEAMTAVRGFSIRGFTISGFSKHGVHLACIVRR
jgi:hypothetical protein